MTHLRLANASEGRDILAAEDDFTRALGTFDRSFRLRTTDPVDDATVRKFLGEQALDFSTEEAAAWNESLEVVAPASRGLGKVLPPEVVVLKTTGREERDHAYTRGHAIVLPRTRVQTWRGMRAVRLLAHELFHVASRASSALRDATYALLDFEKCGPIVLPPEIEAQRVTNPDAYSLDHYLRIGDRAFVPLLVCPKPLSEVKEQTTVLGSVNTMLLEIDPMTSNVLRTVDARETDWAKTIGRNSKYTIHPEEVLADNFMLLAHMRLGAKEPPPDPDFLARFEKVLLET